MTFSRCDADPDVLSDYIVALLKHDAVMSEDQWKEVCRCCTASSKAELNWDIAVYCKGIGRLLGGQYVVHRS